MHRLTVRIHRTVQAFVRIAAALALALTMLPVYAAWAQDDEALPAAEIPLSVNEQLANAPRLAPAPVPDDVELPAYITRAELAQMPDRTQYAVIDATTEGNHVTARVQLPASQTSYIDRKSVV